MEMNHPPDDLMRSLMPKVVDESEKLKKVVGSLVFGRADEYEYLGRIGKGSYGMVYRARDKKTGEIVALKKEMHGLSTSSAREIDMLQSLVGSPWFVQFRQVVMDKNDSVYVVMEYVEHDLARYLGGMTCSLPVCDAKFLMRQLLEGVAFLHKKGIMHRDLKPSNILLRASDGKLKICDFGLSKRFVRRVDRHSTKVASLWYKAPELLQGEERYSCAIDMWSVGCIMAELLLNQVFFQGDSESDQLQKIMDTLGHQSLALWPQRFRKKFHMISSNGVRLLRRLLACNPKHRITAEEALNHQWFAEI